MSQKSYKPRVLFAGLVHETHTFVNKITLIDQFEVLRGDEAWRHDGDTSTLAGGLAIAKDCGWEVIAAINVIGLASGTVSDDVVNLFWREFEPVARREIDNNKVDGVWLNMHGAMVSQSLLDVEGEILRRIRALPGYAALPICGVLDPHGNCTAQMAQHSDGLVAYRKNPHTDGKEAAMDSARILDRLMRKGERAVTVWERPPIVVPPTATGTAFEPFVSIEAAAREIEQQHPDILAVNVFLGFAYADMPDVGVSFSACTVGDPAIAQAELRKLSTMIMAEKHYALPAGLTMEAAIAKLTPLPLGEGQGVRANDHNLIVLIEQSDNIGGGAPGDLTTPLRALLAHNIQNAGVIINDPEAVQALSGIAPGGTLRLPIGGKSGEIGAEPITLDVELISTSDGHFTLEDPHSHLAVAGQHVAMGPCALVRSAGVTILLTSKPTPPFDLAQWRSQGITPENMAVIVVKAAVAHRQAYDPIAKASYVLNTVGPCTADLRSLPFRHVRRPVYPLDEV